MLHYQHTHFGTRWFRTLVDTEPQELRKVRTCVTVPLEPVLPRTILTLASLGRLSALSCKPSRASEGNVMVSQG